MAAGQGFKTFTTGEVLTAADVNGYLMQGVLVFASAAARDAAITSPQEGQFAFTKDTNGLWYYDGAAWVASGATGDIEGVTAGVGISGGGTSGTVTITNSMATEISAKGDLVVGTGSQTFDNLTVGANNTVLTADSSTATGLKWAAAAGGGKVLQVVNTVVNAARSTTSTSSVDITGATATITPSSASSKVLAIANIPGAYVTTGGDTGYGFIGLVRGSTTINLSQTGKYVSGGTGGTLVGDVYAGITMVTYDNPATTSATTYKLQFRSANANTFYAADSSNWSITITLMEIGA
jgi:hypothetical protein